MEGDRVAELLEDDRPGDPDVGGDSQGEAGVVVQPAEDLDTHGAREPGVGEVGLPGLVRQVGGEADVGGAGPLLGLGGDEAAAVQVAADGGRGDRDAVTVAEVPADRLGPGIVAGGRERLPQGHDLVEHLAGRGVGRGLRPTRSRLERRLSLGAVAGDELGDPAR